MYIQKAIYHYVDLPFSIKQQYFLVKIDIFYNKNAVFKTCPSLLPHSGKPDAFHQYFQNLAGNMSKKDTA